MITDTIAMSIEGNEELKNVLNGKSPGDRCRVEVEFQLNEMDDKNVIGSILEVSPINYKEASKSPEKKMDSLAKAKNDVSTSPVGVAMGYRK